MTQNERQEFKELQAKYDDLTNLYHEQDKKLFKDKFELQAMITSAVAEGNRVVIEKIESEAQERKRLEIRVSELENEKANTALKQKKYILTGFAIALFSNIVLNIPYIIKGLIANWK